MTYKEALKFYIEILTAIPKNKYKEAAECSIKALTKQVPAKPKILKKPAANFYVCPDCGKHLLRTWVNYCEKCGQRLDWSEEK